MRSIRARPSSRGDVPPVYSGKDSHDAEAAAAGSDYIGIILRIYPVYMIPFGGKSAVGLGTFPKVEKGAALNGVHQGIVRELGTGGGWSAGLFLQAPAVSIRQRSEI